VPRPLLGELIVSEIFGPTLQGEGPSAGATAAFLRLGMCHLSCSWCDTAYTWDADAHVLAATLRSMAGPDVVRALLNVGSALVVVTGGEPLLQRTALLPVLSELRSRGVAVHVETSGTIAPGALTAEVDQFVVSPKLVSSGQPMNRRYRPAVLADFAGDGRSVFKFVIADDRDLHEADAMAARLGLRPSAVWLMPQGRTASDVLDGMRRLAPAVAARGWRLSPRLQVLLWQDERGR
jgi:7-cyano-7-deazaguanosine (preQ0) biosynthesis protein QueE